MTAIMTNAKFVEKAHDTIRYYETCYVMGGIGQLLSSYQRHQFMQQYGFNRSYQHLIPVDTTCMAFDCIGLIKSILWGWRGDYSATGTSLGGGQYLANNVPDLNADNFFQRYCTFKSDNFRLEDMPVGALVYMPGHIGIYTGRGMVIEANASTMDVAELPLGYRGGRLVEKETRYIPGVNSWQAWGLCDFIRYPKAKPKTSEEKPKGNAIKLTNRYLYSSAWAVKPSSKINGTFYFYDNQIINGKRRITSSLDKVGKKPMCYNVTGFINYKH